MLRIFVRAHVYKLKRAFKAAIDDYTKSLEWKADDGIVYFDRGVVYILISKLELVVGVRRPGAALLQLLAALRVCEGQL
jgi:hypothetical protein